MLIAVLSALLGGAVIYDLVSHRLPNNFLLLGLIFAFVWQAFSSGWDGIATVFWGGVAGLSLFLPFYVLGGMAAGDVKLMAVIGGFLGAAGAVRAGACSLMVGSILGVLYLLFKGQFARFVVRYWAMVVTRSLIRADESDAARHRFPYALAIAIGTLLSFFWNLV